MWIATDGPNVAVLEARPRTYVIGWDVVRLAMRGEDPERAAGAVLGEAVQHLQRKGVPRLFARCRDEAQDDLLALGFRPLGREKILTGRGVTPGEGCELPDGSRYRMPQDAWPLHQLENAVTPPLIRQLEGLTSLDWTGGSRSVSEIVVERDGQAVGWIGWGSRAAPGLRRLGLLVHPDHTELAPVLLRHVLAQAGPDTAFQARVRDYHSELLTAFTEAGFRPVGEEVLMVRHGGVVPARARPRMQVARVPGIQAFPFITGMAPTHPEAAAAGPRKDKYS
jgi:hypothetical protein